MNEGFSLNELRKIWDALELLSEVLDASEDEIIELMKGQLISEEETTQIRNSLL